MAQPALDEPVMLVNASTSRSGVPTAMSVPMPIRATAKDRSRVRSSKSSESSDPSEMCGMTQIVSASQ